MTDIQPGKMLGPYQIINQVGQGGMATVYKAYHAAMDRYVAVKVLPHHFMQSPVFLGRFKQEAHLIAKLEHAHILPVYDFGETDGLPYLVMRYLDQGTLKDYIQRAHSLYPEDAPGLPLAEINRIFTQLASALQYAHEQGVIHRDIKPSNVLLDQRGDAFLTDFGIAKLIESTSELTASGAITGTPAYMSPEQGQGGKIDHRSDIYSLGVVLYEMFTKQVPYEAETPLAVIIKKMQEPLPPPSTINPRIHPAIEAVILKALANNADERFQSIKDFLSDWNRAVRIASTQASTAVRASKAKPGKRIPVSTTQPKAPFFSSRILLAVGILATLVCVSVFAVLILIGAISIFPTPVSNASATTTLLSPIAQQTSLPRLSLPFKDDFSQPANGLWPRMESADYTTNYEEGSYRIYINKTNQFVPVNLGFQLEDVFVSIDATKVAGADSLPLGLFCRYNPTTKEGYFFTINAQGDYSIEKRIAGQSQFIGSDKMRHSYDIKRGNATNQIRITCSGNTLSLTINGQEQLVVYDSQFSSGDIGIWAATQDQAGLDIRFDNFLATLPDSTSPANSHANILFKDDFSSSKGGWDTGKEANGSYTYDNNGFLISVKSANYNFWTTPNLSALTDVIIEVDVTKLAGPDHNFFGLICRLENPDNYYRFTLGHDGSYAIEKIINGKRSLVGMHAIQKSSVILSGSAPNHLRSDCIDNTLTLSVNSQTIASVQDTDLTSGDVGIFAGAYGEPDVAILFDNFIVYQP